ncbi:phosphonate C-P lyase system protein PhnH [Paracoccus onubensis]|uniref:Phosphonate C-P lyase system protein PhnH n=1 Tax=Paracoccus onubensis TaxID=1675788 RepID=A0A418SN06_9RHOB|nr:phosphonate C-P lyase system protein PhnH [Paracoccus onubensis]RJE82309.1 phosphonate C-P lyase system protein PhnH [Paracoccus onubensis]
MDDLTLAGGFSDPAQQSAQAFRAVMSALARPGRIEAVRGAEPPAPLSQAAGVVLLTLCDPETPVYLTPSLDLPSLRQWIGFHAGAPIVGADECSFAIGPWEELLPLDRFRQGCSEYPDRSATLLVETPLLEARGATLRGPGIRDTAELSLPEIAAFQQNARVFPLGLDFIFTCGDRLAALPRSTEVV